jgi:peptide deformylase
MADEDEASEFMGYKKVFINPRIVEYGSEEDTYREGCLSLPGINETVKRPTKIKIQYLNENFESIEEEIEGFKARAIQHEYDHLEGKVFVDRISPIRRQMNKSKLSGMAKGKVRCHYRVKTV